jgi:hypothetical protein
MSRPRLRLAVLVLLALPLSGAGEPPAIAVAAQPAGGLPAGRWRVAFANGVTEVCDIGNGGESTVEEPRRRSNGMATVEGGAVVIAFHDDRVERWTAVGDRFVVEHWFPGSRLPIVTPVLGIAERIE